MISFGLFGFGLLLIGIAIALALLCEDGPVPGWLATIGYLLCCVVWLWCAGYLAATAIPQ